MFPILNTFVSQYQTGAPVQSSSYQTGGYQGGASMIGGNSGIAQNYSITEFGGNKRV